MGWNANNKYAKPETKLYGGQSRLLIRNCFQKLLGHSQKTSGQDCFVVKNTQVTLRQYQKTRKYFEPDQKLALVLAVENYDKVPLGDVPTSNPYVKDDFKNALDICSGLGVPEANITVLRNDDAQKDAISAAVKQAGILIKASPDKKFVYFVFASGRGYQYEGKVGLFVNNFNPKNPASTQRSCYPVENILRKMANDY